LTLPGAGWYLAPVRNSGKVNPVSILVILAVAGALWWVFTFAQVYLDHMDVQDAISTGFNMVKNGEKEEQVHSVVLGQCNKPTLGWHWENNELGERKQAEGLGLTEENFKLERDEATLTFTISMDYTREVLMRPTDKWRTVHFHVEKHGAYGR
jgi:hypothetical protein